MKRLFILFSLLVCGIAASAQINPVTWRASLQKVDDATYKVVVDATIAPSYHIYDMTPRGSITPTTISFEPSAGYELVGAVEASKPSTVTYNDLFGHDIGEWDGKVSFVQTIRPLNNTDVKVTVGWMACNEGSCSPPQKKSFMLTISDFVPSQSVVPSEPKQMRDISARVGGTNGVPVSAEKSAEAEPTSVPAMLIEDIATPVEEPSDSVDEEAEVQAQLSAPTTEKGGSLWSIILEAVLWGFAALLTPCVFPMVPMTVSFFIKGSENKSRGRFRAFMYGLFIVLLYTVPIAVIILATRFIGGEAVTSDIFNWLATHWLPNILFFVVFMIFAASFFGAFEIVMPGSLVNKADKGSEKGGLGGLFFMALTLVLVSFSCTGPIVGTVIVKATSGEFWEPIITMLAFSIAFALPFTLLALFPSLLKNLPKSGGWLNSVKVVLGFVEVALGFKFLSVADQTYHWGLLDREVYLAIWIVVFSMLGFYLLGKIRFAHDSEVKHVGVVRLSLAIAVFSFVVYMLPGMWGAPLKALSGYLPPIQTQDFVVGSAAPQGADADIKYSDVLQLPHGLKGYFDYEQALEASKRENKPIFLDFTGHGCVNCREMEARVLADKQVLQLLRDEYVIVALYGDDRMNLPQEDWLTTAGGSVLKTLGEKNSYIMSSTYGVNSQPAYLLLDSHGKQLVPMSGYDLSVSNFVNFLKKGVETFGNQR